MIEEIVLFILTFLFLLIIYELVIVRRARKDKKKMPAEIVYLVKKYNLDIDKINYKQLLQVVAIVSSIDMALVVSIMASISNTLIAILVGFILLILFIIVSYSFVGKIYKKEGKK